MAPSRVTAAVFCGTCVALFTEALSAPNAFSRPARLLLAGCLRGGVLVSEKTERKGPQIVVASLGNSDARGPTKIVRAKFCWWRPASLRSVAIIALASAPNVWDAMEYHLPRATMWMSNHSVRFTPLPITRNLSSARGQNSP